MSLSALTGLSGLSALCGAAAEFSVATLPGLALWLEADTGTYQDAARTTPAVADGDAVGGWLDQSSEAAHASQADDTKRPVLKLGIQNGQPVLRFDGSNDYLAGALSLLAGNSDKTLFTVAKCATASGKAIFHYGAAANGGSFGLAIGAAPDYTVVQWGGGSFDLQGGTPTTAWQVLTAVKTGNALSLYRDGALLVGPTAKSAANITGTDYRVGELLAFSNNWDRDIAAVVLCGALTTAQRQAAEQAFGTKYGIAIG